jgi:hypothetical protein
MTQIADWVKLAGLAYAIGFTVILVHTARLNSPVVDAFQFQNILAGLPVWLLLCIGLWLWPRLAGSVTKEVMAGFKNPRRAIAFAALGFCLSVAATWGEILLFLRSSGPAGIRATMGLNLIFICAIFTILFASIAGQALWSWRGVQTESRRSFTALFVLLTVYSGFVTLVLSYAIYLYPLVPQSVGGGHPVQVRLYYKDSSLSPLLGGTHIAGEESQASDVVSLYYRTSSYLLIRSSKDQVLLQIPMEQIHTIVWLESH